MNMKKCENGLWKCVIEDLVFYVETQKEALAIAWKLGGRQ